MSPSLTTFTSFGPVAQSQIAAYVASVSCLAPTLTSTFTTFGNGCPGSNGIIPR